MPDDPRLVLDSHQKLSRGNSFAFVCRQLKKPDLSLESVHFIVDKDVIYGVRREVLEAFLVTSFRNLCKHDNNSDFGGLLPYHMPEVIQRSFRRALSNTELVISCSKSVMWRASTCVAMYFSSFPDVELCSDMGEALM